MTIYLFSFFIAILLLFLSENVKSKYVKYLLAIIALIIPSFVAGARDFGIGRDTTAYVEAAYRWAQTYEFREYIVRFSDSHLLYTVWYILVNLTKSSFWLLFSTELFIELLIYFALLNKSYKKNYTWVGMTVYYFIFYTYSLSLLRQSLAMSIMFFAYNKYLLKDKYKQYLLMLAVSFFIHPTSIICIVIVLVYRYFEAYDGLKFRYQVIIYSLTVFSVFSIIALSDKIINSLISINSNYLYYKENVGTIAGTFASWIVFFALAVAVCLISYINRTNKNKRFEYYIIFLGLSFFWLNIVANNAYRVSLYFLVFLIGLFSSSFQKKSQRGTILSSNRLIISLVLILSCIGIWYIMVVKWRINDIYPYCSSLLGIVK